MSFVPIVVRLGGYLCQLPQPAPKIWLRIGVLASLRSASVIFPRMILSTLEKEAWSNGPWDFSNSVKTISSRTYHTTPWAIFPLSLSLASRSTADGISSDEDTMVTSAPWSGRIFAAPCPILESLGEISLNWYLVTYPELTPYNQHYPVEKLLRWFCHLGC